MQPSPVELPSAQLEYRPAELDEATPNRLMGGSVEFEALRRELAKPNAQLERADLAV
jgi:hypothetical protein